MYFFIFSLWSYLAGISAVRAIKNITVDDFDPQIEYSINPPWNHEINNSTTGRYKGTTSWTTDSLASASLKFNGTAIYFMSFGHISPDPDLYQITLDGRPETGSLRVGNVNDSPQFIGYWRAGLDASREHQIIISNPYSIDLNVDAFIITVPDNSTVVSSSSSADMGDTKSTGLHEDAGIGGGGGPGLTTAVKAGIPVAVIGGILLGVLAVLGISRWQRKKKTKAQDNPLDLARETEGGGASAVVHPFVGAPGGVKRYQAPEAQDNGLASPRSMVTVLPPYAN